VADGQRIRLKGKGSPGERGGPAGDLFVRVAVTGHPVFGRKGDHVTLTVPVTYAEAVLGTNVAVPTPEGQVTLKVPAGTRSGRTFRVKGKGFPTKGGHGDLLVTVEVDVPKGLSDEARAALEAYAEVAADEPRAHLREVSL
jgi:molecular chaperone DnaJ